VFLHHISSGSNWSIPKTRSFHHMIHCEMFSWNVEASSSRNWWIFFWFLVWTRHESNDSVVRNLIWNLPCIVSFTTFYKISSFFSIVRSEFWWRVTIVLEHDIKFSAHLNINNDCLFDDI
jgi:hypothetical protein